MKTAIHITSMRPGATARALRFGKENKLGAACRDLLGVLLMATFFVLIFLLALISTARAQQTIFNVPSSDILDKGKVYGELDVTFKPNDDEGEGEAKFSSFVPRVVVGMGARVEVVLNITGNIQPGDDVTTLVPAAKWKVYDGGNNFFYTAIGINFN